MGAVDDMVGIIPVAFMGKVALDFTDRAFGKTKRKTTKKKARSRKRKK